MLASFRFWRNRKVTKRCCFQSLKPMYGSTLSHGCPSPTPNTYAHQCSYGILRALTKTMLKHPASCDVELNKPFAKGLELKYTNGCIYIYIKTLANMLSPMIIALTKFFNNNPAWAFHWVHRPLLLLCCCALSRFRHHNPRDVLGFRV